MSHTTYCRGLEAVTQIGADAVAPAPQSTLIEPPPIPVRQENGHIMMMLTLANVMVATTMLILTVRGFKRG